MKKRLERDMDNKLIGGVIAGIANYFNHDITLWRLGFIVGLVFTGFFPLALVYLLAWAIMPAGFGGPDVTYVVHE